MSYLFKHIPNDEDGNLFIEQLRNYINRDLVKGVRARGRGSRVKWEKIDQMNYQSHIPQNRAERLHLYLDYQEDNESIENIELGEWIFAYSDDKVIGARQWQGSIIDVPAMGSDGSEYTIGYIKPGATPEFKVLRDGKLIELAGYVPTWSDNGFLIVSSLTEALVLPESFSLDKEAIELPQSITLYRAYPNPFNPATTLTFSVPEDINVILEVYDINGRIISKLKDNTMKAGYHSVVWNADSYSSGVYFVKMQAGDFLKTQKLLLVK